MHLRKGPFIVLSIIVLVIALAAVQVFRPIPPLTVQASVPATVQIPGQLQISWPPQGEAAVEVAGQGVMGHSGGNQPLPIASLTKMMTAYLVLKAHPLSEGQDGPTITVTNADVQTYLKDVQNQDSVAKVAAGEKLTEYQLLQALLLPSGDNIATMLANWVSGSTTAFIAKMNSTAKALGMTQTHYSDVAGVDPTTVSTALDQIKIADAAMQNPIFREIVAQPQAMLPVAGIVYNVDYEVGHHGIVGIKTGSTPEDGANFAFASYATVGGKEVLVIGTVLGQHTVQSLQTALNFGVSLVSDAKNNLQSVTVLPPGRTAAQIVSGWAPPVTATAPGLTVVGWPGMTIRTRVLANLGNKPIRAGDVIGHLEVTAAQRQSRLPLTATGSIAAPSLLWRLERIPKGHVGA